MSDEPNKKSRATGPFAPPTPSEVDQKGAEPMAVARDKQQSHGESFVATTAPEDQFDEGVAQKYGRGVKKAHTNEESAAAEKPAGYSKPDARGWSEPEDRTE